MQMQDVARAYQTKTDEELLELATQSEQLTAEAHSVLLSELARRRIDNPRPLDVQDPSGFGEVEDPEKSEVRRQSDPGAIGEFMAEVLRIYYDRLWLFAKLAAPGVVVGYVALVLGRDEGREIASHLPRGIAILSHQLEFLEIWLANTAGYLVSWMASCFSFGAICSAVRQIAAGVIPSASDCFVEVRQRMGSFVRLSLLLFVLLLVAVAAATLLSSAIFWMLHQGHIHYGILVLWAVSFGTIGLALLVLSRFGLAVPALVLDDCSVSKAMFRSDELTEGRWLTLAILLAKSLILGYVAGMLPFWLTSWVWPYVRSPWWLPPAGSIVAVTLVEPFMFIGFATLYLKISASSPASREAPARLFA
jgi:hypothetical protein